MPTTQEQARGLMAGIAVGNLLGLPYEGDPREWIARACPGGVTDIDPREEDRPDDDDLAQSIIIAEAALEGPLDAEDLGRRLLHWMETNGRGIGALTYDVLRLHQGGMPILEASRTAWGGKRAGNGALMRCAPLAIRWRDDAAALARNSIVGAAPTHWDPRCGWSCVLFNLALAATLRGESVTMDGLLDAGAGAMRASRPELEQYGYDAEPPAEVREAVARASVERLDNLTLDDRDMGYTLLALRVGLVSLWRAPDFEHGLRSVVEAGGDTDTNGAVVGAALGARFGLDAIPERWRDAVQSARQSAAPMESYADQLL